MPRARTYVLLFVTKLLLKRESIKTVVCFLTMQYQYPTTVSPTGSIELSSSQHATVTSGALTRLTATRKQGSVNVLRATRDNNATFVVNGRLLRLKVVRTVLAAPLS